MNYSFMTFSCPKLSLDEVLSVAKSLGYDGFEPRINAQHKHGIEVDTDAKTRKEIKQKVANSGVAISCVATSCRYVEPDKLQHNIDETKRCIDLAADVGGQRIRVFGGKIPDGVSREEAIDLVAESLEAVAVHASEQNVTVCMETHDDWCNPKHVAEVMKRVEHPAIRVNWDVMHPVRTGLATMDEAFEILKSWIRHLHVHDASKKTGKLVSIGEGDYDHKRVIELLLSISYDGFISGEWINWEDSYEVHLPRELATLKRYEKKSRS